MVDLIGITLAALLDRPVKAALEQIWPSADNMQASVRALLSGQEQHRLAPVWQAASHLELGELEPAKVCLLRAESEERHAPVVKLALAMVLARSGVTGDPVTRRIGDALRMNPFLAPGDQTGPGTGGKRRGRAGPAGPPSGAGPAGRPAGSDPVDALVAQALAAGPLPPGRQLRAGPHRDHQPGPELSPAWTVRLTTPVMTRLHGMRLSGADVYSRLMWAAVAGDPVQAGGLVTAGWYARPRPGTGPGQCHAAFRLDSGTMLWAGRGRQADRELVLAARNTLVMRSRKSPVTSLSVLNAETGAQLAEFSAGAFRLLFWPGWDSQRDLPSDRRYRRSHHQFGTPKSSAVQAEVANSRLGRQLRGDPGLDLAEETTEAVLCDPLDDQAVPLIIAANLDRLRRHTFGLRKYAAAGTPGGWVWSTVFSSQPPGFINYSAHATLRRAGVAVPGSAS